MFYESKQIKYSGLRTGQKFEKIIHDFLDSYYKSCVQLDGFYRCRETTSLDGKEKMKVFSHVHEELTLVVYMRHKGPDILMNVIGPRPVRIKPQEGLTADLFSVE